MENPAYEMSQRKENDLQLLSGSVASLPAEYAPAFARLETKQDQRSSCMQNCCIAIFAIISVLALCAAVAAIILVVAFPNVANPAVQEVLVLKDQLTGQLASTSAPQVGTSSEELQRIRETLEASVNSVTNSLETSLNSMSNSVETAMNSIRSSLESSLSVMNSISSSLEDSTNSVNTLLQQLVAGESISNQCMQIL